MKKLSLSDFKDICDSASLKRFIFATENQSWRGIDDTMSIELAFNKMIVTFTPNTIFFSDGTNSLRLNSVSYVKQRETPCVLGKVFAIVCGGNGVDTPVKEYVIVAR